MIRLRDVINGWLSLAAAVGLMLTCGGVSSEVRSAEAALNAAPRVAQPNLIWIMADDLGYGELGCYGQELIDTPHLDQMAAEGLRFTHFYAGATVCAPSRSVLMTGLHHGHTRVRGNAGDSNPVAQALRAEDLTVAEHLRAAGYHTALIGKWGLGDVGAAESGLPHRQGFAEFFGYLSQHRAHNHYPEFLWHNDQRRELPNKLIPVGNQGGGYAEQGVTYADDLFADAALQYVRDHREGPFFLYWSMVVPHANNERRRELQNGAEVPELGRYAAESWPEPDRGHAAMITRMDSYVGRLLQTLRELGIAERTLVIFTSDNGPHQESGHDVHRFRPSGPFTGFKRSLKDGGIRVPCLAWWPNQINPGRTTDHVAYFGDWFATAAELAGAGSPPGLDSISFVPTLLPSDDPSQQRQHEYLYWEFHEGGFQQAALYQGRWKGIRRSSPPTALALYDQQNDPAEQRNIADEQPAIAGRVATYLEQARTESADWPMVWPTGR